MIEAYSFVRRRRAEAVWESTFRAGSTYHYRGPSGGTTEGLCKDLQNMWVPIWGHNVDDDPTEAPARIRAKATFSQ